ncbi:MAG: ABC transporter permease [Pirellulaceae bacterium]|nr:ABC transporter permease [Pirellulaceae bacterium]
MTQPGLLVLLAANFTLPQLAPWSLAPLAMGVVFALLLAVLGRVPLRYNVRNLQVRWTTTGLTAVAFVIVLGLLTMMLAFVNGMYKLTEQSGQPGNVLVLSEGSTDESFSNLGFSDVGDIELQPGVSRNEENRPLCSRETYVVVNQPVQVREPGRPNGRFTQVRGVDDPVISGDVHGLELLPGGRWVGQAGVQKLADEQEAIEAVVGEGIARELGRDRLPEARAKAKNPERIDVGETFPLGGRTWVVVGVIRSSGSTFDSEIWAKRDIVGKMFGKQGYSTLVLRTESPAAAQTLKDFLNKDYEKASVQAYVETEYFASLSETNKTFLYAIVVVTAIMSLGGIFGVMNTMFAAVSQRSRDIAVLRILGYSRLHVLASFLLESLVLAILGGTLGCLIGGLMIHGRQAASIVSSGQGGGGKFVVLEMLVSGDIVAVCLAIALVMGILGGLIPSILAMLIRPLESLR